MYDHAKGGYYHIEVIKELFRLRNHAVLDLYEERNELWQYVDNVKKGNIIRMIILAWTHTW